MLYLLSWQGLLDYDATHIDVECWDKVFYRHTND